MSRLLISALLVALLLPAPPAAAAPADGLVVTAVAGGTSITWHGAASSQRVRSRLAAADQGGWTVRAQGERQLPVRLVALRVAGDGPLELESELVASAPAAGSDEGLPPAPVELLREGRMAGARIAVLAVSPLFAADGAPREAVQLRLFVPNSAPLDEAAALTWSNGAARLDGAAPPTNPAFGRPAARVTVAEGGLQRLPLAAIAAAGLPTDLPPRLRLRRGSVDIPLELHAAPAGPELRFFAPPPGDRWNRSDSYWLTLEGQPGPSIATRDATPGSAPASAVALEVGSWRAPTTYESRLAGPDGDHWFNTTLRAGAGAPVMAVPFSLATALPAAPGPGTLLLRGSAATAGPHSLNVTSGAATATGSWSGAGDWSLALNLSDAGSDATLTLHAGAAASVVSVDSASWERPVRLELGGQGARFRGLPGRWRYTLAGHNPAHPMYDVTDPGAPVRLTGVAGGFEDSGGRDYLVAGPGTLHEPALSAAPAQALPQPAAALYIAPVALHEALAPLLALRRAQGHSLALIDVQTLYDAWSGGQVDPLAIRAFLRYAAATWPTPPAAAVLVGDGTVDPHGYSRAATPNLIPPLMAPIDPWLGETACEPCFAQLDGASPLDDPLPDLALGRLPVKSASELAALVAKLVAYETAPGGLDWRSRALFVADNGVESSGVRDAAGDFAALADAGAALLPAGVQARRVYYDPWIDGTRTAIASEPWRIPDAVAARRATVEALRAGAGLVTYVGHSHHWQWASTGAPAPPDEQFLLGLNDAGLLNNGGRLPIVLELTCLTAAFQKPAASGTTLDERLLLNPSGGAAAVWGPTGMGVAYGHGALQRGVHAQLWRGAAPQLGDLVRGGQLELFTTSGCCQEALQTYALLGDPLVAVRAAPASRTSLPLLRR